MWKKVFKNGPSKICGRQPLKNLKGYGLLKHVMLSFSIKFKKPFRACFGNFLPPKAQNINFSKMFQPVFSLYATVTSCKNFNASICYETQKTHFWISFCPKIFCTRFFVQDFFQKCHLSQF